MAQQKKRIILKKHPSTHKKQIAEKKSAPVDVPVDTIDTEDYGGIEETQEVPTRKEDSESSVIRRRKKGEDISSLYSLDEEESVDMTKMEQKRGRGRMILAFAVVLSLLGVIGYFGYGILKKDFGTGSGDMVVSVSAEEKVASGDLVTIVIEYVNEKNVDVVEGDIELFYPDGFQFHRASVDSSDEDHRLWSIDRLRPGAAGRVEIQGQIVGEKDEIKKISALLTYQPSNFSRDFQISAETSIRITSSLISVDIEAPDQLQSGQEFTYGVTYTSTSKVPLEDIRAIIDYPEGFSYTRASREPTGGSQNQWDIDVLQPNESQTIEVVGTLDGESGKTKEFRFQLGIIELDNTFRLQIEKTSLVVIVNPEVELSLDIPSLVDVGEEVEIVLHIKNSSQAELHDVIAHLTFDGAPFTEEDYTFDTISTLLPLEEKKLSYKTRLQKEETGSNHELEVVANVLSAVVEGQEVHFPNQTSANVKVRGSVSVNVEGRYFDESLEQVGSGPLPPVVGEETSYIVRWHIRTGSNAFERVSMRTTLPESVVWKNDATPGVFFREEANQVVYEADQIDAHTTVTIEFAVSVIPEKSDVGKLLVLTEEALFHGKNSFTQEDVSLEQKRVTTNIPEDEGAEGKGVVEEQ